MQGQQQQQAYDRGTTIFSPDGRLYQVEYAREAVKRGSASIGVRTPEGVVLLADKQSHSPLLEPSSVEKLIRPTTTLGWPRLATSPTPASSSISLAGRHRSTASGSAR
jgi:20S proteasome, alpha and beta subunits